MDSLAAALFGRVGLKVKAWSEIAVLVLVSVCGFVPQLFAQHLGCGCCVVVVLFFARVSFEQLEYSSYRQEVKDQNPRNLYKLRSASLRTALFADYLCSGVFCLDFVLFASDLLYTLYTLLLILGLLCAQSCFNLGWVHGLGFVVSKVFEMAFL
ncbi:hypothetical protein U1Q18_027740 [Sarracenia purpurea var. burkii]